MSGIGDEKSEIYTPSLQFIIWPEKRASKLVFRL